ncbi:putative cytochrome b5-like heme steroid binding domain-containing protein [Rosellinia necatrix]|uniref:Putative cytochrome b5-like heme steroid binding domain-containing protein n=1 Tax=Rosellinia necatrix TaxID=77044 RepID=A0A1W2TBV0_ROSNE|nr:putative cytochrome b5-like heme steroid binding domain-containing protein [Rosellinia necatrix]
MALLGLSLILASVVYVAIRRPPLIETLIALCRGSPSIQQPPSTRRPSTGAPAADTDGASDRGRSSAVSVALQDVSARRVGADRNPTPKILSPSSPDVIKVAIHEPADTPSPPQSPQTTPKAKAVTALANGAAAGAIPSFSLSPSSVDAPASAAAVARAATMAPPALSAPSFTAPSATPMSMSMPPPPRPPRLNNNNNIAAPSRLAAPPGRPAAGPLPAGRQAQYDRQAGSSTLAPPPTHSSKPSKPSRKVTLAPGRSPLDWARLADHPAADLRGPDAGPSYLRVTPAMLRRQTGRRGRDAWTALGGRVYNVTPYLPFHPGGAPELLRAAGRDGTRLFAEIHSWVNYETMLASCLVGLLVDEADARSAGEMDAMD